MGALAPIFIFIMADKEFKEYKKHQKQIQAKQRQLERLADEILRKDEEAQKLKQMGKNINIDVDKFKKLF
jgi:cell division protein FtsB